MRTYYATTNTYYTLFDFQYESRMYSVPHTYESGKQSWKWIPVSTMESWHLFRAIRLQMLAIQDLEDRLATELGDVMGDNHKQINKLMNLMNMRFKRMFMLGDEYALRTDGVIFSEMPTVKLWLSGDVSIDGVYPYRKEPVVTPTPDKVRNPEIVIKLKLYV